VRELLGLDAQDQPLPEGERPEMLADANLKADTPFFTMAAQALYLGALEALLAAGANPHALDSGGWCALSNAVQVGADAREAAPGAAAEVDAVIDCCAQAQLGMPYAEHAASLTVGSAVAWTNKQAIEAIGEAPLGGTSWTIADLDQDGWAFVVQGARTGQKFGFSSAAQLRLA